MAEVQKQMESGNRTHEIEVDLKLSVLKPLHATWLVSLYNHLILSLCECTSVAVHRYLRSWLLYSAAAALDGPSKIRIQESWKFVPIFLLFTCSPSDFYYSVVIIIIMLIIILNFLFTVCISDSNCTTR